uniref:Uncharacterized protein n=1 Tax=Bracon brevicornis TaxID=1563983 RepID=A0A6V7MBW2_9HYME
MGGKNGGGGGGGGGGDGMVAVISRYLQPGVRLPFSPGLIFLTSCLPSSLLLPPHSTTFSLYAACVLLLLLVFFLILPPPGIWTAQNFVLAINAAVKFFPESIN